MRTSPAAGRGVGHTPTRICCGASITAARIKPSLFLSQEGATKTTKGQKSQKKKRLCVFRLFVTFPAP
jgi:hypothetical protein